LQRGTCDRHQYHGRRTPGACHSEQYCPHFFCWRARLRVAWRRRTSGTSATSQRQYFRSCLAGSRAGRPAPSLAYGGDILLGTEEEPSDRSKISPRDRCAGFRLLRLQFCAAAIQHASRDREAGNPDRRKGFCRGVIRVLIVAASPLILASAEPPRGQRRDIVVAPRISSLLPSSSTTWNRMSCWWRLC